MKTLNFKIEEKLLTKFRKIAKQYHENNIYCKLTNHSEMSAKESKEILIKLNKLSDEDLEMETIEKIFITKYN